MATSPARRRSGFNPLLVLLLLVLAALGTIGTLHATGKHKFAFIDSLFGREVQAADHAGKVAVTLCARPLEPGQRVERADLWDATKNMPLVTWVDESAVEEHWRRAPTEIEDRVMARPKSPGKMFTEGDFLPVGSHEGPVGLVPEGMRLLSLDPSKVQGIDMLGFKDRFDLVVSEKVDEGLFQEAEEALERQGGAGLDRKLELANLKEMAHQRVLVQNAMLISAPKKDAKQNERVVQVAVWPDEVLPLLEALDLEHTVYCTGYSGNSAVLEQKTIPAQEAPLERLAWIYETVREVEVYNGSERTSVAVPKVQ